MLGVRRSSGLKQWATTALRHSSVYRTRPPVSLRNRAALFSSSATFFSSSAAGYGTHATNNNSSNGSNNDNGNSSNNSSNRGSRRAVVFCSSFACGLALGATGAFLYNIADPFNRDPSRQLPLPSPDHDDIGETLPPLPLPDLEPHQSIIAKLAALIRAGWMRIREGVIEPCATAWRFIKLVIIFAPVVVLYPVTYFGHPVHDAVFDEQSPLLLHSAPESDNGGINVHRPAVPTSGELWWYDFLTSRLEWAGPTFIKLGQWAATRPDLLPPPMCHALSRLHSKCKPHSFASTRAMVEDALKNGVLVAGAPREWRTIEDAFEQFDRHPVGVGAISQVYYGILRPLPSSSSSTSSFPSSPLVTSQPVAVKVLHPRAARTIRRDLMLMSLGASVLTWLFPSLEWFELGREVQQFAEMMQKQLDMTVEARNMISFRNNFGDPLHGLFGHGGGSKRGLAASFSTPFGASYARDILVESYEDAVPLALLLKNTGHAYDGKLARIGLNAFLHMIIYDNFIHADLHPGNILVSFRPQTVADLTPGERVLVKWFPHLMHKFDKELRSDLGLTLDDPPERVHSRISEEIRTLAAAQDDNGDGSSPLIELLDKLAEARYEPVLTILDTGLVASLDEKRRRDLLDLFSAVCAFDGYTAGCLMVDRSRTPQTVVDRTGFALKMEHLLNAVLNRTLRLSDISFSAVLSNVMDMVRQHRVRLEADYTNIFVAILILEGIGRQLDPNIDILKVARPILRDYGLTHVPMSRGELEGVVQEVQKTMDVSPWIKVLVLAETREWMDWWLYGASQVESVFGRGHLLTFDDVI